MSSSSNNNNAGSSSNTTIQIHPSSSDEQEPLLTNHHHLDSNYDQDDDTVSLCNSHVEPHFSGAEIVRDVIIGLSDGLTVPFALAAGLAVLNDSRLVLTAGLAEIIAGSISMGLGGWLAGKSEIEHYDSERKREEREIILVPHREEKEIEEIFEPYGLTRQDIEPILEKLKADHTKWVDFMMKFELNLERPEENRSWISALTIGFSYMFGGFIPLIPYAFIERAQDALIVSIIVTLVALFIFGFVKAIFFGTRRFKSGIQTMIIGAVAAGAAYGIAGLIPQEH